MIQVNWKETLETYPKIVVVAIYHKLAISSYQGLSLKHMYL